jgi:RNA ligase (TIGR02306 family)
MEVTYERDCAHCSPSTTVREVTVKAVLPAENSDNLERVLLEEVGWECVETKGRRTPGEKMLFIPPESVLPLEMSDALNVTNYLSKGKVKAIKLRGNRSEGLLVDKATAEPFLAYVLQWEDLPSVSMKGIQMTNREVPIMEFPSFYKIPNLLNEPDIFKPGEDVVVSEKLHGTNSRFGVHRHPDTGEYQLYVGSHNLVLKETEDNLYWKAVRKNIDAAKLPKDHTFYGECTGRGIQHFHYGEDLMLRVFAVLCNGRYLSVDETVSLCEECGIAHVAFHKRLFADIETARAWAEEPSEYTDRHGREGIVIREASGPVKFAKVLSGSYLAGKNRTERH